ncbi:MAG: Nif3-like dinuclear metal center hexameric protein [Deltaproteobacteria bacterium]|jgi:dinuclear metal center YbgI/SA1388 family protein|nr:Nif3-like dinuclear metal center hexameric protein [Deltaproteobacteria bacterium]
MLVKDFLSLIDHLAPFSLALSWDNSGLQVGDPEAPVQKVALALDPTDQNVQAALDQKADLLLVHHPALFKPLKNLAFSDPTLKPVLRAIKGDLAIIAAHTNWDLTGVPLALAETLELTPIRPLELSSEDLVKLTVFTPLEAIDRVKGAIFEAGAGRQGHYSDCSFEVRGVGQYLPGPESDPFLGYRGVLESAEEYRLETLLPKKLLDPVTLAIRSVHPYEEPAFEFTSVTRPGPGLGLLAKWPEPIEALPFIAQKLGLAHPVWAGPAPGAITQVALLPGSGGDFIQVAQKAGAEMLITGEMNYHHALLAGDLGFCVLAAGHYETEKPGLIRLGQALERKTRRSDATIEYIYLSDQSPWRTKAYPGPDRS